jgi:hypothetical protein
LPILRVLAYIKQKEKGKTRLPGLPFPFDLLPFKKWLMTDLVKGTFEDKTAISHATDLLTHYSFDLGGRTALQLIDQWLNRYQAGWIRWAVIEALYQGRYKAVSVDQILQLWQRRKHPCYHFSYEFERLVCHKFPRNLSQYVSRKPIASVSPDKAVSPALPAISQPREVDQFKPLSWSALAEQIQPDEVIRSEPPAPDTSAPDLWTSTSDLALDNREVVQSGFVEVAEELPMRSAAQIQAGMEALINQATSHLNASTEAGKTKLLTDETRQTISALRPSPAAEVFQETSGQASVSAFDEANQDSESYVLLDDLEGAEDAHLPIHQFTPAPDGTDFHSKLKAVAEHQPKDLR